MPLHPTDHPPPTSSHGILGVYRTYQLVQDPSLTDPYTEIWIVRS